jgi:nitrate reductase beta subunit
VLGVEEPSLASAVGLEAADLEALYRLLAIAKYADRYVIPLAHTETAAHLTEQQGSCGLDFAGGPGSCGASGDGPADPERTPIDSFMLNVTQVPGR